MRGQYAPEFNSHGVSMLRNNFHFNVRGGQYPPEWQAKLGRKEYLPVKFTTGIEGSACSGISTIQFI